MFQVNFSVRSYVSETIVFDDMITIIKLFSKVPLHAARSMNEEFDQFREREREKAWDAIARFSRL